MADSTAGDSMPQLPEDLEAHLQRILSRSLLRCSPWLRAMIRALADDCWFRGFMQGERQASHPERDSDT